MKYTKKYSNRLKTSKRIEWPKRKKWIIYLGIYTGARRGELAQLRKCDVKLDEQTNRYYLLITDDDDSQNLKTDNAKRKIPLHQDLINAGFIDYVDSCSDRVFHELKNVEVVTGWMPRNMERLKILVSVVRFRVEAPFILVLPLYYQIPI